MLIYLLLKIICYTFLYDKHIIFNDRPKKEDIKKLTLVWPLWGGSFCNLLSLEEIIKIACTESESYVMAIPPKREKGM